MKSSESELDLLSSELRNNPNFCKLGIFNDNQSNAEVLCVAYQENIIGKDQLEAGIEKENFDYPISLPLIDEESIEYEDAQELFKGITSKDVDDGEGNFEPDSQKSDDDY